MKQNFRRWPILIVLFIAGPLAPVTAQNALPNGDDSATVSCQHGVEFEKRGKLDSALILYSRCYQIRKRNGDIAGCATALESMGNLSFRMCAYRKAILCYQEGLAFYQSTQNDRGTGAMLNNLGLAFLTIGVYDTALQVLQRCLTFVEQRGNKYAIADACTNIGNVYVGRSDFQEAIPLYTRAAKLREEIGDSIGLSKAYNNMGVCHFYRDENEQALVYFERVLQMREQLRDTLNLSSVLLNLGLIQSRRGRYASAVRYFNRSIESALRIQDRHSMLVAESGLGTVYLEMGDYRKALDCHLRSVASAEELEIAALLAAALQNVGSTYARLGDMDRCQQYYQQSLRVSEDLGDKRMMAGNLIELGAHFESQGDLVNARAKYTAGLRLSQEVENPTGIGMAKCRLAGLNVHAGAYDAALEDYGQALNIFEQIGDVRNAAWVRRSVGNMFRSTGDLGGAILSLQLSLDAATSIGALAEMRDTELGITDLAAAMGDYKTAYEHFRSYGALRDTLINERTRLQIHELTARYDQARLEKDIAILQRDKQERSLVLLRQSEELRARGLETVQNIQRIRILTQDKEIQALKLDSSDAAMRLVQVEKERMINQAALWRKSDELKSARLETAHVQLFSLFIFTVLLIVIGLLAIRQARTKRREAALRAESAEFATRAALAESHRLIAERERREKEMQRNLSRQLVQTQEQERARIASDLHDGLGHEFIMINNLSANALHHLEDPARLRSCLHQVATMTEEAIQNIREISHNLRPSGLDRAGLTETLWGMLHDVRESTAIHVDAQIDMIDGCIGSEEAITIYRIVQEATSNVIKHARATTLRVHVRHAINTIDIAIEDDGCGFVIPDSESMESNHNGIGLSGMRERVRLLSGSLNVISNPGTGTRIAISIPLHTIDNDYDRMISEAVHET